MSDAPDARTDAFERQRRRLFGIAYRMLSSVMEAEDIVQEAYLRYQTASLEAIREPDAYLTRIVTNLCLDRLKSAAAQREVYVGEWLPEPLPTPDDLTESESETISMAFLLILERLSPVERAVFLLHEVFDYSYAEIAVFVGKDEVACRQVLHRAKAHVMAQRPRYHAAPDAHQAILTKFVTAVTLGDMDGLLALLAEDAVGYSDGGGKVHASPKPIVGAAIVARLLVSSRRLISPETTLEVRTINGTAALILRVGGAAQSVISLETDGAKIQVVRIVLNLDKLRHL
ncbi:MAG TPA: RNA polymerase sigma-70 factor [Aggregatilineales bacterium]|nr:RNA polymerase sigma-70 factor [Anaerolineales bacterium]HRE46454.1 RNA polymerase sigma-70 factor [Aggregatilineales bacterium]